MKRKLLLLTVLLSAMTAWADVQINQTNFPDIYFRNWLLQQDFGKDGVLTDEEIASITSINVRLSSSQSLKGIEYFTALKVLDCSGRGNYYGKLTELDLSKNTALETLRCMCNQLTSLDVSGCTSLKFLDCKANQLTALDVSKNTALTFIDCCLNQVTALDVTNNVALDTLSCYDNQLTALDLSKNGALTYLDCNGNPLMVLDVTNNPALKKMYCTRNQLSVLDVSKNTALEFLNCWNNQLTSLDVSGCTVLKELQCDDNQLTSLDVSNNTALTSLLCGSNQLSTLDVSKNTALTSLTCSYNQLTSLNVSGCTGLTSLYCHVNQLTSLNVSGCTALTNLSCYQNQIKGATMDEFVESLPTISNGRLYAISDENEQNVMTKAQVTAAKEKGWIPYYKDGGNWQEYEGSDEPVSEGIAINETNFPDENFRNLLLSWYEGADSVLTDGEIALAKYLPLNNKNIRSLKGIEFFTALTELDCSFNQLTELDLSKITALKYLDCSENYSFTTLDLSKNTELTYLNCSGNILTTLDLSKNTELTYLNCSGRQLKELNISGCVKLTEFMCWGSQIKELDLSNNTALKKLYFYDNQLTTFDVSNNTALEILQCDRNQLTELDVSKCTKLTLLGCTGNQLRTLNVSNNKSLKYLYCYTNQIKGEGMDALVKNLPTVNNNRLYAISDENEQNEMTKTQVAAAKEKGWIPYYKDGDNWQEYEGSEPEPVVIAEETTVNPSENAEPGQATTTESGVTTSLGDEDVVDTADGSVTIVSSMTNDAVKELIETTQPGSSYFNEIFKGFYFLLAAGKGKVEFDIETLGGYSLGVMKGTELVGVYTQSTKGTVTIPYDLEEDTWFFAYPVVNTPAAANRAPGEGALKVYGLRIIPETQPDGINDLSPSFAKGNGAVYNLQGQRMNGMQKGINIVDGKKVMVK